VRVRPVRCFPWTQPERHVSLRDDEGRERLYLADLASLDAESARALRAALNEAAFVFEIEAVESVEEEFQLRDWRVRTRQGPRAFQTREEDWPTRLPGGALLIRDLAGDSYVVRANAELDPRSRRCLAPFID
jgi:hypothetical protein